MSLPILDNAIGVNLKVPPLSRCTWSEEKDIAIEVKDQGMGMDAETLQLIFEKFYREQGGNVHNIKGHGLARLT